MILFIIALGIILFAVENYSMSHTLDQVELTTSLDKVLVEPEEEFFWTMTVKNGKRFLVPYLKIREQVPEGLTFSDTGEPVEESGGMGLSSILYLAGRQKTELVRKVLLKERGRYFFRGSLVEAGDFLGIRILLESYPELTEMVVKPRPYPGNELSLLLGGYLGEFSVEKSLFEDPILTLGFREYTGREPFSSISWTQSARFGTLLVKQQECMSDMTCTVILNTECRMVKTSGPSLEKCFSMVRSVCEELERKRIPYDFCTNGIIAGAMGNWRTVEEGLGAGHLSTILEGLGRMTYDCREETVTFYSRILKGSRAGRSFLLVAPEQTEETERFLLALEERSGRKALFLCAKEMEEA